MTIDWDLYETETAEVMCAQIKDGALHERVSAFGFLLRLGTGVLKNPREALRRALLVDGRTPYDSVREAARESFSTWDLWIVRTTAMHYAHSLIEDIESTDVGESWPHYAVRSAAFTREGIAQANSVLNACGFEPVPQHLLDELDALAEKQGFRRVMRSPQLCRGRILPSVAWQYPKAWWGASGDLDESEV